jgi:hypothetical protein
MSNIVCPECGASAIVNHQPDCSQPDHVDTRLARMVLESCGCHACLAKLGEESQFMVLCRECGCKRCPKATNHRHDCTRSNDSGQVGSSYGTECEQECCTEYRTFMAQRAAEWDELFPEGWRDGA